MTAPPTGPAAVGTAPAERPGGVEFRLLGDVEVWLGGRRVDPGHTRQRYVLAALLVDLNHPVPAERLAERVWADRPPHRSRNVVSAYVSRLRALLAGWDEVRIGREPGGYRVTADPVSVDLHRFRELVTRARAAGDPATADACFGEALRLCRGEPLTALDTPWAAGLRESVRAERLAAVLDRNDAALAAGRHSELLGELAEALAEQPLDERLAGQLMLAQYRAGRQADALDTYRRMRATLVEELGTEPGPLLRGVHQRVLDGDPAAPGPPPAPAPSLRTALAPPPPRAATAPVPASASVPAAVGAADPPVPGPGRTTNLPRRPTSFIGRERELRQVVEGTRDGPLLTLLGVGGAGKTRLAVEAAGQERERYRHGVWLCELAPLNDGAAVTHAVASALGVRQQHGLTVEQTVIEYLRVREVLLVLDNCEHVLDAAAALMDLVVRHCPGVSVLATSREALGVEGERILPVPPLAAADATALFADRARAGRPDFVLDDQGEVVAEICRRLDGLPLAIELAAARVRVMNAAELVDRLDPRLVVRGGRGGLPRHQSLAAAIDWSYALLSEPEQVLFARLSVFAAGFDLAAAHGVCAEPGATEDDTFGLLTGLVDKSMVTVLSGTGRTRYRVLETLRAYGRARLPDGGAQTAARHAEYFTALAEQAAIGVHSPDEGAWVDRLLPEHDNLRVASDHALARRDTELALRLMPSLPELVHLRGGYEAADWAQRTLALAPVGDPRYVAVVGLAARGAWNRGDFAGARALGTLAGGRFPPRGTGRVAYPGDVLADVALYEGDGDAALRHYASETARARADADPIRLVWTLYYVAICHCALRRPEDGVAAAEESVRVAETTANPTARSMGRYALGLVLKKSEPGRALVLFDEAAELAAGVRNFWWQGIALMEAAATRGVHGDPGTAARGFLEVIDLWDRVGDWTQQWLNLRYVTRLLIRVGAESDTAVLHRALVAAGKPSPLGRAHPATDAPALTGPAAVAHARTVLGALVRTVGAGPTAT